MASPTGYYDRYRNPAYPKSAAWTKVLANPSRGIQASEFNELQSIINERIKNTADGVFNEASFVSGGSITTTQSGNIATVNATLSGNVTIGDVITLTFTGAGVSNTPEVLNHTTVSSDKTIVAASLAALINNSADLIASNITAVAIGEIIAISYPSIAVVTVTRNVVGTGVVTISTPPVYVLVTAGTFYTGGYFFDVPSSAPVPAGNQLQSPIITGVGTEILGLSIDTVISTISDDPTLGDQVSVSANAGNPGADRETFTYEYVINDPSAVTVATFVDGQLLIVNNNNGLWERILALLALRTNEESGSFVVERPTLSFSDVVSTNSSSSAQIKATLENGIGYAAGVRVDNSDKKAFISVQRPMTTLQRVAEGTNYTTGTKIYTIDNSPYLTMDSVLATSQSPSFSMVRGSQVNGRDAIPVIYQPTLSIVSVTQGPTVFDEGVDYNLNGNFVQWLSGGVAPASGSTYSVVVQYTRTAVKGIRTYTPVSSEAHYLTLQKTATIAGNLKRTITVGGVFHTGDVLHLVVTCASLTGSPITINYTTLVGDTDLTGAAVGFKNAINANAVLVAAGFVATNSGAVITLAYPATLTGLTFGVSVTGGGATETLTDLAKYINDTVAITFTSSAITGSPVTKTYTLVNNDNATSVAAGLVALIMGTAALTSVGVTAANVGGVITIGWPINIASPLTITKLVTYATTSTETCTLVDAATVGKLTHSQCGPTLTAINSVTSAAYLGYQDFVLDPTTGIVTWLTTPPVVPINFNYAYWVHTLEGDYVSRDSFVDSSGNQLYYAYPTFADNYGSTIDYAKQIYWTASGNSPINSTVFYMTYSYVIGRTDVLVWNTNGTFEILPGVPSLNPVPPTILDTQLPLAQLNLPPESFAVNVGITWYNNLTLLVTDLRTMQNQINTANYNLAQFQLAQEAFTTSTVGAQKKGVFADPFVSPAYADVYNSSFAGTFDFLSQTFQLPRTMSDLSSSLTMTGSGASLKGSIWMTNYIEVPNIIQPYTSQTDQVNEFGFVNLDAKITLNPAAVTAVNTEFVNIISQGQATTKTETFQALYMDGYNLTYWTHQSPLGFWATDVLSATPMYSYHTYERQVYAAGVALSASDMMNSQVWQNISPSTAVAIQAGTGSSSAPSSVLDQIPINPDWSSLLSSPANASVAAPVGVIQQNQWATIISNAQIVTNQFAAPSTITVSGSIFIPSKGGISCLINNEPVPLTGINGTIQDPSHTGSVVASATGTFTATFVIPSGTPTGNAVVQVVQSQPSNPGLTASMAASNLSLGSYTRNTSVYSTFTQPYNNYACYTAAVYYLCNLLGFMPNSAVLNSVSAAVATTIAEAVVQAKSSNITLNNSLLVAAMAAMFKTTTITPQPSPALLTTVANAVNYNSLDPNAVARAIIAVAPSFSAALKTNSTSTIDPLAQTFTPAQDCFVTSIDLFFSTAPLVDGTPVTVALATTDNGFPTQNYMAQVSVPKAGISIGGNRTKFTFDQPVFLKAGVEYAFVVKTNDVFCSLYTARLGGIDPTLGLITSNPASGVMLSSPNASTWTAIGGADIKFTINIAQFSTNTSTINLGSITFPFSSSIFAFYAPFALPSPNTNITWQYSIDGATWINFYPCAEVDLGSAYNSIFVRIVLNGTAQTSPIIQNAPTMQCYIWLANGCYIHRQMQLANAARYFDVYCDLELPGNTTATFEISFDDGVSWTSMTEETADQIDINGTWVEKHYHLDYGSALYKNINTRCTLTSGTNYITPRITSYRLISS